MDVSLASDMLRRGSEVDLKSIGTLHALSERHRIVGFDWPTTRWVLNPWIETTWDRLERAVYAVDGGFWIIGYRDCLGFDYVLHSC